MTDEAMREDIFNLKKAVATMGKIIYGLNIKVNRLEQKIREIE